MRVSLLTLFLAVALAVPSVCITSPSPAVSDLLCQRQRNPGSVVGATPEFSWRSGGPQGAYQILVSSAMSELDEDEGSMWDSGRVVSSEDSGIAYAGKKLDRNARYYWKVRVWDSRNGTSACSEVQMFGMGNHLLDISPSLEVKARNWNTLTFTLTVGEGGMPAGGGFTILSPCDGDTWHYGFKTSMWTPWQTEDPAAAGYTRAFASRSGARIALSVVGPRRVLTVRVRNISLRPDDTVTIVYGDPSSGSPGVQAPILARRYFFPLGGMKDDGRYDGMKGWLKYKDSPSIVVLGNDATRLHPVARPYTDGMVDLRVSAIDEDGNLDIGYEGRVSFSSTDRNAKLPASYTFTPFDRGVHTFEGIYLKTDGLQTISVYGEAASGTSNVLRVTRGAPEENVFFGDIHGHSMFSDGMVWIDDQYEYMRDASLLDFGAVTDHGEASYGFTEDMVVPYAERFYEPDSFVTFCASEWTRGFGYGHKNNYFLDGFGVYAADRYKTPGSLWGALEGKRVITPPHHAASRLDVGPAGYNGLDDDPEFQPCVEIYSVHGSSECIDNNPMPMAQGAERNRTVQYLLGERGYRMGIYASSDAHVYMMGSLMPDPENYQKNFNHRYGTALIAVYAPELTREAIFEAIKDRRTYGTTGERILLEFSIDGNPMGSEYVESGQPEIAVTVGGTDVLERVEVMKYSNSSDWERVYSDSPGQNTCSFNYTDTSFAENSLYYVRVTQRDGEMAWSSPVWVDRQK
jgi:hypothetical protein